MESRYGIANIGKDMDDATTLYIILVCMYTGGCLGFSLVGLEALHNGTRPGPYPIL